MVGRVTHYFGIKVTRVRDIDVCPGRVTHCFGIRVIRARDTSVCPSRVRELLGLETDECVFSRMLDHVTHCFEPQSRVPYCVWH